jgi:hypothetical protein
MKRFTKQAPRRFPMASSGIPERIELIPTKISVQEVAPARRREPIISFQSPVLSAISSAAFVRNIPAPTMRTEAKKNWANNNIMSDS